MIEPIVCVGIAAALCYGWHRQWGDVLSGRPRK